jgi:hypothetical protein
MKMNKFIIYARPDSGKSSITVSIANENTGNEVVVKVFTVPYSGLYNKLADAADRYAQVLSDFLGIRYE